MNALQPVLRNKVPGLAMAGVAAILLVSAGFAQPQRPTRPAGSARVKRNSGAAAARLAGVRRVGGKQSLLYPGADQSNECKAACGGMEL